MKKTLKDCSDEELTAELKRRAEEKAKSEIPTVRTDIDWRPLILMLEKEIDAIANEPDHYVRDDFDYYVFERVMNTVYDDKIWDWWNKHT
jgi:hypothetical protein